MLTLKQGCANGVMAALLTATEKCPAADAARTCASGPLRVQLQPEAGDSRTPSANLRPVQISAAVR